MTRTSESVPVLTQYDSCQIHVNTRENTYWWSGTNYEPVWHLPTGSEMVPCLLGGVITNITNAMQILIYPKICVCKIRDRLLNGFCDMELTAHSGAVDTGCWQNSLPVTPIGQSLGQWSVSQANLTATAIHFEAQCTDTLEDMVIQRCRVGWIVKATCIFFMSHRTRSDI